MPARQTGHYGGLELLVVPHYWLRRLSRFPFYFESTHPSFRISIKRVSDQPPDEGWEDGHVKFEICRPDGQVSERRMPAPQLAVGESMKSVLEEIYSPLPGQVTIQLPVKPLPNGRPARQVLYSYYVRREEEIWLWLIGLPVAIALLIGGAAIQRWLGLVP
jgi:hypothetical protein